MKLKILVASLWVFLRAAAQADVYTVMSAADTGALSLRQAILDAGEGGGFVLCPSAGLQEWPTCDAQTVANFLAYIEAGHDYGKYPLKREW